MVVAKRVERKRRVPYQLHRGDCLEVMQSIADRSINLICCDLPFETTGIVWDKRIPMGPLWAQYKRVLAPGGCVVLFGSMPFTADLVNSNRKWYKDHLVWDKNKCGSPALAKIRPMRVHEDIIVFAPGRTVYNPQMEEGTPYARKSKNPEGYVGRKNDHGYGMKPRTEFSNEGTRYPKGILRIPRNFSAQQQVHPTQKPVPLLEWIVRTYSNKGDRVLDNAMGIGTCGEACGLNDRPFIGIEKDEDDEGNSLGYFDEATHRIGIAYGY